MNHYFPNEYFPEDELPSIRQPFFHELFSDLFAIEQLVNRLRNYPCPLFGPVQYMDEVTEPERLELQQELLRLIKRVPSLETLYPHASFSVLIRSFIDCVGPYLEDGFDLLQGTAAQQDLNQCVEDICHDLQRPEIRKRSYRANEKYADQEKGITSFINHLFARHGRVMVLRLDFGYRIGQYPSFLKIGHDRDKLIRYLRERHDREGKAFLGCIWRIEYGQEKGYHLHMLILLNANRVREDVTHGRLICDYWNNAITRGSGTAYNCNANKQAYRFCGIGEVKWNDRDKRKVFKQVALYLAKPDPRLEIARTLEAEHFKAAHAFMHDLRADRYQYDRIRNGRVFGTSQLEELHSKRGRHRHIS